MISYWGRSVHDVVGCEIVGVWHHIAAGVDFFEGLVRRDGFEAPQVRCAVQDLALQVGDIDDVGIDDSQCSNASRGEIKAGWAAQSARADEEYFGVEEFALSAFSHFGDEEVTGVALYFGFVERAVAVNGEAGVFSTRRCRPGYTRRRNSPCLEVLVRPMRPGPEHHRLRLRGRGRCPCFLCGVRESHAARFLRRGYILRCNFRARARL